MKDNYTNHEVRIKKGILTHDSRGVKNKGGEIQFIIVGNKTTKYP